MLFYDGGNLLRLTNPLGASDSAKENAYPVQFAFECASPSGSFQTLPMSNNGTCRFSFVQTDYLRSSVFICGLNFQQKTENRKRNTSFC
ncbi:hypothetical protein Rcae01_00424 [Novipirellula caenicola]|uniref:CUB domain-containing protein n=1 Tax=Novipirellula caenicola TaxID=1536901 RepID=A0ABP9VK69_9BACT